jgi:hypothetical protein
MALNENRSQGSRVFTVPIDGLSIARAFSVGPVEFLPSVDTAGLNTSVDWEGPLESRLARRDSEYRVVASVGAESIESALDCITQSLEVLRVFQFGLMRFSPYTHFGLPGEITATPIPYIRSDDAGHACGWSTRGHFPGFTLAVEGISAWEGQASGLQFAASGIASGFATESSLRALTGVRYFARAILAEDADLRAFLVVAGLEALGKRDFEKSGRFQLARRYTYLSCWLNGDCGRIGGAACPYVALDPLKHRKDLQRLEELTYADVLWRCTYWEMINTWYTIRSGIAHGSPEGIEAAEASKFAYWTYHQYLAPMLNWLLDHPEQPIEALDEACDAVDVRGIDWPDAIRRRTMPVAPPPEPQATAR